MVHGSRFWAVNLFNVGTMRKDEFMQRAVLQYIMQAENELNGEQNYRIIKSDLQSAKETLEKAVHEMCGWLNFNELEGHRECAIDIAE